MAGDAVAVEFGVRGLGGVGVAGHVDLGDDRDVAGGGVADDGRVVGLGEVSGADAVDAGAGAAADGGQARPGVDLDAPSLVVGQVQVQVVDFVLAEQVDISGDLVDGVEVPGEVEHGAAVGEARVVDDASARDGPAGALPFGRLDLGGEQLAQRLGAGEETGGRVGADGHPVAGDVELVALLADAGVGAAEEQGDLGQGCGADGQHGQRVAGGGAQGVGELAADPPGGGGAGCGADDGEGAQGEGGPVVGAGLDGGGDDVVEVADRRRGGGGGGRGEGDREGEGGGGEESGEDVAATHGYLQAVVLIGRCRSVPHATRPATAL